MQAIFCYGTEISLSDVELFLKKKHNTVEYLQEILDRIFRLTCEKTFEKILEKSNLVVERRDSTSLIIFHKQHYCTDDILYIYDSTFFDKDQFKYSKRKIDSFMKRIFEELNKNEVIVKRDFNSLCRWMLATL